MRRRFKRARQVMSGLLSAVLLMTLLPQESTYVYAAEQMEEQQTQTEETADGSENAEIQDAAEKSDQEETSEEKTDTQNADSGESDTEEETETQDERIETEESIESEREDEEQETEYAEETDAQETIVTAKLTGAYQFGDAPSERDRVSGFSISLAADTDTQELEEYLYQQMKERNGTINVQEYSIHEDRIGNIVYGVINEHPDLYFVRKGFSYYKSGNNVTSVILEYDDSYDDNAFQKAVREALAVVKPGMSDLEIAIVLHDYLAVNCEYDKENLDNGTIPDASYTAYGTLVNRTSVCEGYALAYKYLLNQSGIDCLMVNSSAMNHAWNLVRLNGKYYQVDVTWDDPTWDKIGRARHQYMFRSDDAFVNECRHYDWTVTEGSEVVDYEAADTSYDSAFWLDCDAPLVLLGEDCYYVTFDEQKNIGVVNKNTLSDITGSGTTVCDIGTWTVWNGSGYWKGAFSGLFYVNGRMYYNDQSSIRSFALDDAGNVIDNREEFEADTTGGYIYGSAFCQGKVLYSLHQNPNESAKETVLTADITIEAEEPPQILVEKIELDKELLTLTVGDTAVLKAAVTPAYATDAEIIWESSDNAVAEVSGGTITAVAAGSCTITASAGGKTAVCEVTVTGDEEDVIAGGSYEGIIWKIDTDGKLTVTGTGDFSESTGFSRAPWYNSREHITSAEFHVTDMTDASAMLYHCENLTSVDVSGLNTGNVTDMSEMFKDCSSLTSLDLGNFDTGKVTDMHGMFSGCSNLTDLDLSSFNAGALTDISDIFSDCTSLTAIYTPCSLTLSAELPMSAEEAWYQPDGTEITELPQNLGESMKITKRSVAAASDPYITVQKIKTVYECGDILNTDDLTVTYYDKDGTAKTVTDYTTNAEEIDMSVQGTKTLEVNYNGLTATVELTVTASVITEPDKETYTVTFDLQGHGTALEEYSTYTEIQRGSTIKCPTSPQAEGYEFTGWYKDTGCQILWDFEKDTVEEDTILYAGWKSSEKVDDKVDEKPVINSVLFPKQKSEYSAVYTGEQIRPAMVVSYQYTDANGKIKTQKLKLNVDYTVCYSANVNAGENTAQVTVRGIGGYTGIITREFTITPKNIKNVTLSSAGDIVFGEQPSVRVTDGTMELVEGRDYNIILSTKGSADADTQSVLTVEGIGNYTGASKKSVKFNILKVGTDIQPITSENIHVEFKNPAKKYTYNGKAQKPGVVVTDTTTGKKVSSSMYKVIYSDNVNAGKGTAKVWVAGVSKNGKGYYGISEPLYFDIDQKDFKKVTASLSGTIPKTGSIEDIRKAIEEAVAVKDAKHVLSGSEYTIDYGDISSVDAINIGTQYSITLTPKAGGNYTEGSQKTIKVKFGQLNLASKTANIKVSVTDASKSEIKLFYNGILLEKDKDYTATVKQEKNKDTYTVKIKAVKKSAYKGSRTIKSVQLYVGNG